MIFADGRVRASRCRGRPRCSRADRGCSRGSRPPAGTGRGPRVRARRSATTTAHLVPARFQALLAEVTHDRADALRATARNGTNSTPRWVSGACTSSLITRTSYVAAANSASRWRVSRGCTTPSGLWGLQSSRAPGPGLRRPSRSPRGRAPIRSSALHHRHVQPTGDSASSTNSKNGGYTGEVTTDIRVRLDRVSEGLDDPDAHVGRHARPRRDRSPSPSASSRTRRTPRPADRPSRCSRGRRRGCARSSHPGRARRPGSTSRRRTAAARQPDSGSTSATTAS